MDVLEKEVKPAEIHLTAASIKTSHQLGGAVKISTQLPLNRLCTSANVQSVSHTLASIILNHCQSLSELTQLC